MPDARRSLALLATLLLAVPAVATLAPAAPAAAAPEVREHGYLPARDGTLLEYTVVRPGDGAAALPTLMEYSGYNPGAVPDQPYIDRFLPKGYNFIGVNVRGTGCSGGTFNFFEPAQATDGYDAIEWIASRGWSDGKVAMIGKSFPGITQLFVAATQPPHLVAAAPGHVYGDIYRDVAYPGGIFNYAFAGLWSFVAQPAPGTQSAAARIAAGDATCAANVAARQAANARDNAFVQAQEHPFDDALIRERSPVYVADRIRVPLYMFQSWQDEQVGPRGLDVVETLQAPYWLTVSNGDHGMYRTDASLARLERFFDHFVKEAQNHFENESRVVVWWDAGANGTRAPAWTRAYPSWPVTAVEPLALYLHAGEKLTTNPPVSGETPDAYVANPAGTTSNGAGYGYVTNPPTNAYAAPKGTRLAFNTTPLAQDVVVLGPGNFTFWAASTVADTDFQVTVNEIRPDGHVVFVQKGWLRASHRALDGANSSAYRPVQRHTLDALAPLVPGRIVQLNVEVFPFGHAFRVGSRVQVVIEAPQVVPELWGFVETPAAVNLVYHDPAHPSALVLPVLPGERADVPLPACGSLVRQKCV